MATTRRPPATMRNISLLSIAAPTLLAPLAQAQDTAKPTTCPLQPPLGVTGSTNPEPTDAEVSL